MRGRTNVMQRKEPTINGLVKYFIVASGNTIAKGDFVSYKLQAGKKNVTDYGTGISQKVYDKANDLYIALYQKHDNGIYTYYVCLVDISNDYEVKQAFMFTSKPSYDVDNNGNLLIGVGKTFYAYKYQNSEFVLIDSVTTVKNIVGITKGNSDNEYIAIVEEWGGSSYHYSNLYGQKITVSSTTVTLGTETLIKQNAGFYTEPTNVYCDYVDDNQFVIVWSYPYVNYNSGYVYYMICSYQNGAFVVGDIKSTETLGSGQSLIYVGFLDGAVYTRTRNKQNVYIIENGTLTVIGSVVDGYIADNEYIVSCSGATPNVYSLYKWDKTTGNLTKGATYTSTVALSILGISIYFVKGSSQIVQVAFSVAKLLTFDVETLDLFDGNFDNIVESYSGNFTVGFAKTSGTAGDTIQVYVPQISS